MVPDFSYTNWDILNFLLERHFWSCLCECGDETTSLMLPWPRSLCNLNRLCMPHWGDGSLVGVKSISVRRESWKQMNCALPGTFLETPDPHQNPSMYSETVFALVTMWEHSHAVGFSFLHLENLIPLVNCPISSINFMTDFMTSWTTMIFVQTSSTDTYLGLMHCKYLLPDCKYLLPVPFLFSCIF